MSFQFFLLLGIFTGHLIEAKVGSTMHNSNEVDSTVHHNISTESLLGESLNEDGTIELEDGEPGKPESREENLILTKSSLKDLDESESSTHSIDQSKSEPTLKLEPFSQAKEESGAHQAIPIGEKPVKVEHESAVEETTVLTLDTAVEETTVLTLDTAVKETTVLTLDTAVEETTVVTLDTAVEETTVVTLDKTEEKHETTKKGKSAGGGLASRRNEDGLNECVLLEDDSSMPEGEQISCTPTIFRGFGVTDGPAINESFCTCLMEGPHRFQLQMSSKLAVGVTEDAKFCIFTEDFSKIPTNQEVPCTQVILRAFSGQTTENVENMKCTCSLKPNGNAFLSYSHGF
ncbi:uncharacterized protein LOC111711413 isoform X2 [Eurytemora carolleeae]|uniref:uncharacterized protein LOC111711413 isoform X2 n=1 Tax=Eurytemora carolleeae TaxID=1294199 RepID=UPI000C765A23|nr:uncharacterized protein LOC111711413 isoform X2 [Eurytemora carolleeae]|eukprot:XP_023341536.1 uncharacterized protein LOC111711413 isoform X2 [Eurytemora affinis]